MPVDFNDNLGTDVSAITDVDLNLSLVDGRLALAQALLRRLALALGGLWYDLNYGGDVLRGIGTTIEDTGAMQSRAEDECLKDERVQEAEADITFSASTQTLVVVIKVTDIQGATFEFTFELASDTTENVVGKFSLTDRLFA